MHCSTCWKTTRDNTVLWFCRLFRVKKIRNHHYSSHGEPKATMAEHFNHALMELTYKYMTAHNTLKYLHGLPKLLDRYN